MKNLLSSGQVEPWFQQDYLPARGLFLESLAHLTLPLRQRSWSLPGEPQLTTDTAWIGSSAAKQVVVVLSGSHGVEGYFGSAVQSYVIQALSRGELRLPADTAMLMVHALNPWGMIWARRCDAQGVDLNRNFVNFDRLPEPAADYHRLLDSLSEEDLVERRMQLSSLASELGQVAFDQLFSGGQYHCAWAPFYGGTAPSFASQVTDQLIQHWQLEQRCLIVIDLHSGLGPWGHGELISDHPIASAGSAFARHCFGAAVAETASGESCSVPKQGLLDYRWHRLMAERGCFITLEFGSYGTQALFDVLLSEHLYWKHHPEPEIDDPDYLMHRRAMLEHFCPRDPLWRQMALFKSLLVVERAMAFGTRQGASTGVWK